MFKIFDIEQRSEEWLFLRGKLDRLSGGVPEDWIPYITPFRLTASEIYCLSDQSRYKSRSRYLEEVLRKDSQPHGTNEHMERGQRLEPSVRQMYSDRHGIPVEEVGFVVPDWCPYLGVSPDGFAGEGCIEIKCPVSLNSLIHEETGEWCRHEHYAQMQMVMAVCEKPWCDYVVYSERDNAYAEKRILRDRDYWSGYLYPLIREAVDECRGRTIENCLKDLDYEKVFDSHIQISV
jgi:putative phage-type endonuclease